MKVLEEELKKARSELQSHVDVEDFVVYFMNQEVGMIMQIFDEQGLDEFIEMIKTDVWPKPIRLKAPRKLL